MFSHRFNDLTDSDDSSSSDDDSGAVPRTSSVTISPRSDNGNEDDGRATTTATTTITTNNKSNNNNNNHAVTRNKTKNGTTVAQNNSRSSNSPQSLALADDDVVIDVAALRRQQQQQQYPNPLRPRPFSFRTMEELSYFSEVRTPGVGSAHCVLTDLMMFRIYLSLPYRLQCIYERWNNGPISRICGAMCIVIWRICSVQTLRLPPQQMILKLLCR